MNTPSHNGSVAKQALEAAVLSGLAISDALFVADAHETLAARPDEAGIACHADLAAGARAAAADLKRGRATDAMAFAYSFQVRWAAPVTGATGPDHLGSEIPRTADTPSPRKCPVLTDIDSGTRVGSNTAHRLVRDDLDCEVGATETSSTIRARRKSTENKWSLVSVG